MKYLYPFNEAKTINKFGVAISIFNTEAPSSFVHEETKAGHFEEFYNTVSTYTWFIIEGQGTFVIDDEKIEVTAKDLVVVPPNKRIHYFGDMKMLLCVTPAFDPANEHHVREVTVAESPYTK